MTRLEKLKMVKQAYLEMVPGIVGIALQDYDLVLTKAPAALNEMIAEEEEKERAGK